MLRPPLVQGNAPAIKRNIHKSSRILVLAALAAFILMAFGFAAMPGVRAVAVNSHETSADAVVDIESDYSLGLFTNEGEYSDEPLESFVEDSTVSEDSVLTEDLPVDPVPAIQTLSEGTVPLTDAVAGLPPVPDGAVGVATQAQLNAQIVAANANNAGSPRYIFLTASFNPTSAGFTNINAAGLLDGGQGLTIDGRGHRLAHAGTTAGNSLFRVQGGTSQRALTLKNFNMTPAGGTAIGDNAPLISFSTGSGASSGSTAADSRFWTVNLHNIRSVNAAGNNAIVNRGLIALSDGEVNFFGTNFWHLGQRRILLNARMVNFVGGDTELRVTRTATVSAAEARRTLLLRAQPSNDTARELGVGVTLSEGAQVYMNRIVNSGTTSREGPTLRVNSGALTTANIRPAILNISGGSSLTVIGNPRGVGSGSANNGVVSLQGGSGGVSVTDGSELLVHNTRRGTGNNAGTSALIQQIRGGNFVTDGEGSRVSLISESAQQARQATLRFYMDGGVSNQTVEVTNGAELNVERRHTGADNPVSALRFGQGTGNGFYVNNATVSIINQGTNTTLNPGVETDRGFNAAVEFAANNWYFRVAGDSDMHLRADRGAAINARGHANGEIQVGQGSSFTAQGITAGVGDNDAAIRATGGNVHMNMNNPLYFDFVNMRAGGGRVFALGAAAGNSFTSTNADFSVWRRGVNPHNGEPDNSWTLIDLRLSGAHLRTIDAAFSDPDFVVYYNTSPNTRRMESFTRVSGNNGQPIILDSLDLTNADRHVRALVEVPQGRQLDPRPAWSNEIWADFTHTDALTGDTQLISSNTEPAGELVRSFNRENLFDAEINVDTADGTLRMTHDDGRFLRAGDTYSIDAAWRSHNVALTRTHQAENIPPSFVFEAVRDVVPPQPVVVNDMIVPVIQTNFGGTWSLEDDYDDGPLLGTEGIRLQARNGTGPVRDINGSGQVLSGGTWTFVANPGQLFAGDFVWVSLADTQETPNWNPIQATPVRDRIIPEAGWFMVAPEGTMPVIVQHFFDGEEDVSYRFMTNQLTSPGPDDLRPRTANFGTGTSTDTHVFLPFQSRTGYRIDRIELRAADGSLAQTIPIDSQGRPINPIAITPQNSTIHVVHVLDPEQRSDILVEFRFADYGGTGAGSWTLQVPVPYTQVRTGTFNADGIDRFPTQGIGDFHITEALTRTQVLNLVNSLFEESFDPDTGEVTPPAIDGLPRGFVPSPDNFIELPRSGAGTTNPQLEFPVSMIDLDQSRVSAAPGAARSPIVVNFEATLETVSLSQLVQRCPELGGTAAQLGIFDNMSFNYEVLLSRAPVGGLAANGSGATPWNNHRLQVTIDTERTEDPISYQTHTWHAGTAADQGRIRIGTWNNANVGMADSGAGTTGAGTSAADRGNRRIGIQDSVLIANVPSTALIAITQQVNGGPAGETTVPSAGNITWLDNAIHNHHERDFFDSYTNQRYLWPASAQHLPNNATHTTNWANPLPTDNYAQFNPGRPMEAMSRDFTFRLVPQNGFILTVTNYVEGLGADMDRPRNFSIRLLDINGNNVATGRTLMLFTGQYERVIVGTDPESGDELYRYDRILTPIQVGANGTISEGLPALLPGESFSVQRTGGMYQAIVTMEPFEDSNRYDISSYYIRERESLRSNDSEGMVAGPISFNRDYLRVTFENYREPPVAVPAGLMLDTPGIAMLAFGLLSGTVAYVVRRNRLALEKLASNHKG